MGRAGAERSHAGLLARRARRNPLAVFADGWPCSRNRGMDARARQDYSREVCSCARQACRGCGIMEEDSLASHGRGSGAKGPGKEPAVDSEVWQT